jgi:DNA-binding response OmpR family regulator
MNPKKILIVDDDKELIYGMTIWLRSKGYQIIFAIDATTAISIAQAESPDLILLDIGLPGGDGYQTMARLRALMPLAHIPIIVISGKDASLHQEKALKSGAEAFFQKPVDNHQLLIVIQKILGNITPQPNIEEHRGRKILIIDDDRELVHALTVRLKTHGYDVQMATDGVLGISLASKGKPDLILLDLGLPGGDGYLIMSRLKSLLPLAHIPIIVISAKDAAVHEERALKSGAAAFLSKPVENNLLLMMIKKALGENPHG